MTDSAEYQSATDDFEILGGVMSLDMGQKM